MNSKHMGIGSILISALLFSSFGLFIRQISKELTVFPQLAIRAALASIVFFAIAYLFKGLKRVNISDLKLLILRGVMVVVDFSTYIIAVNNLPLGLTLFVFFAASLVSSYLYGNYFLGEKTTRIKLMSLLLALIGLAFIYSDSFTKFALLPLIAALISGADFGLTMAISKKLTSKYSLSQVNLFAYITATLLTVPLVYLTGDTLSINYSQETWWWLIGFTTVAVSAFYISMYGYKLLEAQIASLVLLSEILFVTAIGFIFYQEVPSISTIIGGGFILGALSLPNIIRRKNI